MSGGRSAGGTTVGEQGRLLSLHCETFDRYTVCTIALMAFETGSDRGSRWPMEFLHEPNGFEGVVYIGIK